MYRNGIGVEKDATEAFNWYSRAADQGNALAQFNLANLYRTGEGVSADDEKAFQWYARAAAQGNALAQTSMGYAYRSGEGVAQDDVTAFAWFERAAKQGYASAQTNLGFMYANSRGLPESLDEDDRLVYACAWFLLAAEQGEEVLRVVDDRRQTEAALRLARELQPSGGGN